MFDFVPLKWSKLYVFCTILVLIIRGSRACVKLKACGSHPAQRLILCGLPERKRSIISAVQSYAALLKYSVHKLHVPLHPDFVIRALRVCCANHVLTIAATHFEESKGSLHSQQKNVYCTKLSSNCFQRCNFEILYAEGVNSCHYTVFAWLLLSDLVVNY